MTAPIASVERGSEVIDTCPECADERLWCEVLALTSAGPVLIGRLIECDGCGNSFACALCVDKVEFDGAKIYRHVADRHAGVNE